MEITITKVATITVDSDDPEKAMEQADVIDSFGAIEYETFFYNKEGDLLN